MQGRVYTVEFNNAEVSGILDFFEVSPADDKPCRFLGVFVGQVSDVTDAAEEILPWRVIRGHTTSGSVGTAAPTPRPVIPGDPAASFAAEAINTTIASAGTPVNLHSDAFNVRTGLVFWWTPETAPMVGQGQTTQVIRLMRAPADALTMSGTLYVLELG